MSLPPGSDVSRVRLLDRFGRMRSRVLVAWIAQAMLVLGLALSIVAAGSLGAADWSFVAVMTILLAGGIGLWLRFGLGLLLMITDVVYLLMGFAIGMADYAAAPAPFDAIPRLVSALWFVGGLLGLVSLVASTHRAGRPSDDVDTTAY